MASRPPLLGLLAAFLGTFIALLDLTIVNVALPAMQVSLHTDLTGVQSIVDSFALCMAAFMLSGGLLGDRIGRKRSYLAAVLVFLTGSLVCALAGDIGVLIAGRVVQGLAAAVVVPGALSLVGRSTTDPAVRGRLMGLWGMVASLAVIAGPLLGGALVDGIGWPGIFYVNVPLGVVVIIFGVIGLAESSDPSHASFDPAGQVLGVVALGALGYGAIEARDLTANAGIVIGCAVVFVAATVAFILVEQRVRHPMVPVSLFRNVQFSIVNAASVALGFGANGAFFLINLYLQQVRDNTALQTGLLLLPMTVAIVPASLWAGRLIARYGPRVPLIIGYSLVGASLVGLIILGADTNYWLVGILFAVSGIGQGLAIVPAPAAVLEVVPRERSGVGSAIVSTARQVGTAIGIAVLGAIVNAQITGRSPDQLTSAFVAGFRISLLVAGLAVLSAAAALLLWRGPRPVPITASGAAVDAGT